MEGGNAKGLSGTILAPVGVCGNDELTGQQCFRGSTFGINYVRGE